MPKLVRNHNLYQFDNNLRLTTQWRQSDHQLVYYFRPQSYKRLADIDGIKLSRCPLDEPLGIFLVIKVPCYKKEIVYCFVPETFSHKDFIYVISLTWNVLVLTYFALHTCVVRLNKLRNKFKMCDILRTQVCFNK